MRVVEALRNHWPEYLIEGWALGTFMLAAAVCGTLLEYPRARLHGLLDAPGRRLVAGIAMGLTAIAIIYSPWGKRSGAHMNPSVTLAFLSLGRVSHVDAAFFILAQFLGGTLGVLLAAKVLGAPFTDPPVSYAATLPGERGAAIAFGAEFVISVALIFAVLFMQRRARTAPFTGLVAGALVALYIALEAPYSGMSMNPARSFASAALGGLWQHLWVYCSAPIAGMLFGAGLYRHAFGQASCAKLIHAQDRPCIHCGYEPLEARNA